MIKTNKISLSIIIINILIRYNVVSYTNKYKYFSKENWKKNYNLDFAFQIDVDTNYCPNCYNRCIKCNSPYEYYRKNARVNELGITWCLSRLRTFLSTVDQTYDEVGIEESTSEWISHNISPIYPNIFQISVLCHYKCGAYFV